MNLFEGKVFYDFFLKCILINFLAEVISVKNYHMYIFSLNMKKRSLELNQYQTNKKLIKN